jgi:hypothetical protein
MSSWWCQQYACIQGRAVTTGGAGQQVEGGLLTLHATRSHFDSCATAVNCLLPFPFLHVVSQTHRLQVWALLPWNASRPPPPPCSPAAC